MLNILADSLLIATLQPPVSRPPLNPEAQLGRRADRHSDKRRLRGWLALMGLHL
jgi:hypothetical protein